MTKRRSYYMKRGNFCFELRRKLFHFFFGLFLTNILFYSGRRYLMLFLSFFLILGGIMIVLMLQGRIAFFVFSLPACLFVGWIGVAMAAIAAAVESLDTPLDDNL